MNNSLQIPPTEIEKTARQLLEEVSVGELVSHFCCCYFSFRSILLLSSLKFILLFNLLLSFYSFVFFFLLLSTKTLLALQLDAMGLAIQPPPPFELVIADDAPNADAVANANVMFRVRAKWAFDGQTRQSGPSTHLAFERDEELAVIGLLDDDREWLIARNAAGQQGTIPANRVVPIDPVPDLR